MRIEKITNRTWNGVGFGYTGAGYGVKNRSYIRIIRDGAHWYAYIKDGEQTIKFFGTSKNELESELTSFFESSSTSDDTLLAALGPCGR